MTSSRTVRIYELLLILAGKDCLKSICWNRSVLIQFL